VITDLLIISALGNTEPSFDLVTQYILYKVEGIKLFIFTLAEYLPDSELYIINEKYGLCKTTSLLTAGFNDAMQYTIPVLEKVEFICKLLLFGTIVIEFISGGRLLSARCKTKKKRYPPVLGSREQAPVEQGDS
jgi:hypothetical protein